MILALLSENDLYAVLLIALLVYLYKITTHDSQSTEDEDNAE